ncbi:7004_t:CDS:2 [Acaulospora colombiana]|uniref:7004_t:CDS:1 n=1 Tax=Acaulospora colombiana TaxID=27376 RepID=A0ACA9KRJ3_9GLOM|nr:7004_t:CDS:2 [Acaulospora colombiana]
MSVVEESSQEVLDQQRTIEGEDGVLINHNVGEDDSLKGHEMFNIITNASSDVNHQKRILKPREIEKTFRIMAFRKLQRQVMGRYQKRSKFRLFWIFMFVTAFSSLMGVGLTRGLVIATIALLIVNHGSPIEEGSTVNLGTKIVFVVLVLLEFLTLVIWAIIRFAYPQIVRNAIWLDTVWWWMIKEATTENVENKAAGEVDENGWPHGRGEWVDDSFDGECLKGIWEHGVPVGPFQARASGTGDAFHAIRVGFVRNRHTPFGETRLFPRPFKGGLDIGVATVECSVSGKYLKHLPNANLIIPQESLSEVYCNNISDGSPDFASKNSPSYTSLIEHCLKNMTRFGVAMGIKEEHMVVIRFDDERYNITGYHPIGDSASRDQIVVRKVPKIREEELSKGSLESIEYTLEIDGWEQSNGLNMTYKEVALKYVEAFEKLFTVRHTSQQNLRPDNSPEITESKSTLDEDPPTMKLSSVTLLNPDASLDSFASHDYPQLYKYCDHITVYSNSRDFALKMEEFFSRSRSLGRKTDDIYHNGGLIDVDLIDTTQLDVNIHKMRHNFFNLNRLLVDDLCDIIVLGKRANERKSRLSRRERGGRGGMVYTFLVAPSYVVNK